MPQDLDISQFRADDPAFPALSTLWFETFFLEDGEDRERMTTLLADFLDQSDTLQQGFCARINGKPVGMVLIAHQEIDQMHDHTPWLAGFVVDPAFRHKGIGEALVRHVEAHSAAQGCETLWLYTYQAESYYLRLGWTVTDRFDWHDGTPFVLMRRDFATSETPEETPA
ncbi:MAG: GNAT family N-acetyltransferase [Pseudomonadota bacterium]